MTREPVEIHMAGQFGANGLQSLCRTSLSAGEGPSWSVIPESITCESCRRSLRAEYWRARERRAA